MRVHRALSILLAFMTVLRDRKGYKETKVGNGAIKCNSTDTIIKTKFNIGILNHNNVRHIL